MTDPLNIGIRFALYADLMLLFGLPLFGLYALKGAERLQNAVLPLRSITVWLSLSGIILSLLGIVAMTASRAGVRLLEVDTASVSMMIFETTMGNAWQVRMLALVMTLAAAQFLLRNSTVLWLSLVAFASAVTLSSLAWTGHGAASEGAAGTTQLIADIIHLLGAGAWLGALAALTIMLFQGTKKANEEHLRRTHRVLKGFSVTEIGRAHV